MLTVRVGRLSSRRGVSAIRGFVALGVDSLLNRVRDAKFLVGLTLGEPGTQARGRVGVGPMRLLSLHERVRGTAFLLGLTWGSGDGWPLPGCTRAELTA